MLRGSRGEVEAEYIYRKNVLTKGVPKMDALVAKRFFARWAHPRRQLGRQKLRIFIPTRDSAKWVGIFLDAYRAIGVEPLYIVDARSADGTLKLLRAKDADCVVFTPSGDYAEAGMVEFGARAAGGGWLLRLDDDEFPTRALLDWIRRVGRKSLNQVWQVSRRELFCDEAGAISYSRSQTRYPNPYRRDYLHPQPRFFHAGRVKFLEKVHTPGFVDAEYFDFAPEEAFIIHCNCLLRTPAERLDKILRYEDIRPGSSFMLADEYLPELYSSFAHHNAGRDGLEEFAGLFAALPIAARGAGLEISGAMVDTLTSETEGHRRRIDAVPRLSFDSADDLWPLRFTPHPFRRRLAELLCTLGARRMGTRIWNYLKATQR